MLSSMRFSRLACVLAVLSWTSLVQAADILRITEVMSNSGTGGTADWFELTNYGTTTVNLLGYKMDDNSFAFGTAVSLATSSTATPPTMSIAAGESVIFIEGTTVATSAVAGFRTAWGLPSSVQVNGYAGAGAGVGLSSGGDGLVVFDTAGLEITPRVSFGAATTGLTFAWAYNASGVLGTASAGVLSAANTGGAISVTPTGMPTQTGSPGTAVVITGDANLYWSASGNALGGAGTWNASGANWSPTTSPVIANTWIDTKQAIFAGAGNATVNVGSTVSPLSLSFQADGYTLASSGSATVVTGDIGVTTANQVATINAPIVSAAGLNKSGDGRLVLGSTANSYSGTTSIIAGTLQLGADNAIPDLSLVAVARFATMDFNGHTDTVGGLAGLGNVVIGPSLTLNITGTTDSRLDGTLSGTGDLIINSTGTGIARLNSTTQTFNTDLAVKNYSGKTIVRSGGLSIDRTAVPIATTQVDVEAAGQLLLSPNTNVWASAPDQIFTFGSSSAVVVSVKGGTIGQGAGDDVELANTMNVTGTATVSIKNKATADPLAPSTQQCTFSGPLTGPADAILKVLASDTTSGLAQSRAKFTSASGNTFAGTVSPGPYAVSRFNGDFTQTSVALEGGKVDGYGAIKSVSGAGIVSPDGTSGPDGILTVGTINPSGGVSFNFDLNSVNAPPTWSSPTMSGSDVLRLTGATPLSANLTSANVVRLFVGTTPAVNDSFDAGFFTPTNQTTAITNAAFTPYILGDGYGTDIEHSGLYYYSLTNYNATLSSPLAATVSMVSTSALFDGVTSTSGYIMRTTFTAAPTVLTINVASGSSQTQTQAGSVTISGTTPLVKTGGGTLVLDQANTLSGSTTVSAGVLQLATASALAASSVTVAANATLSLAPAVQAVVAGLSLAGKVDLDTGRLVIPSGGMTEADLRAAVIAGRNGGTWNGASGIESGIVAAAGGTRAVGYKTNSDGSLTVAYGAQGDTNLDGFVNLTDLSSILAAGKYNTAATANWAQGDFNYDGVVNLTDLSQILSTGLYNAGSYLTYTPASNQAGSFNGAPSLSGGLGMNGAAVAVPEPATGSLLVVGLVMVLTCAFYRQRKNKKSRSVSAFESPEEICLSTDSKTLALAAVNF